MKVLDLFSGIGGFSLGLEWAGMSTKAMCEKDPYCRKVLAKHWPGLKIHEDIRDLDGKEYANSIDVVAGGFPCQPFSQAGRRKGRFDDRHLWPEMFRVIKESKPRWVIGENVFGFINMALSDVQSDLESEHYEVRKFVLPAVAVDARHRRDRCFVLAHTNGERQLQQRGAEQEVRGWVGNSGEQDVTYTNCKRLEVGESIGEHTQSELQTIKRSDSKRRENVWLPEPGVGRVADGVPGRVDRLKGLGNAVVPQLIQAIGEIVIKADREIYS